jgi:hypothetical protein
VVQQKLIHLCIVNRLNQLVMDHAKINYLVGIIAL